MDFSVTLKQQSDGTWVGRSTGVANGGAAIGAVGDTREGCLADLRRQAQEIARPADRRGEAITLIVEATPSLAGVAEAAAIMGWDKRRVVTYIDRGRFPQPLQQLASGRVWRREDVEAYAEAWHARQAERRRKAARSR